MLASAHAGAAQHQLRGPVCPGKTGQVTLATAVQLALVSLQAAKMLEMRRLGAMAFYFDTQHKGVKDSCKIGFKFC